MRRSTRHTPLQLDEMSIVDVLTKLIFDAESELRADETLVLESLGEYDRSLAGRSRLELSEYLRSMGVDEMIAAVNSIKQLVSQKSVSVACSLNPGC